MNICHLIGHVGKAPELRNTQDSKRIAKFSLATTKRYRDKHGERQEQTTWHNCVCFQDGLCGVIEQYVNKGSKLAITGEISNRTYEKDGETKYISEVIVRDMEMLDSKPKEEGYAGNPNLPDAQAPLPSQQGGFSRELDDSVPF